MATLLSRQRRDAEGRRRGTGTTVHTGSGRRRSTGPRMVRRLNIDGDGQGDLDGHGGEQRAVLVYQTESYALLAEASSAVTTSTASAQFGENFTVDGLPDDEVCIGDRYRIGDAEFEVTQPRVTCYRVGLRLGEPRLPALLVAHHRPGLLPAGHHRGPVEAGDEIVRTRVGPDELTVADDRRPALPARPRSRPAPRRARHPGAQPRAGWQSFHDMLTPAAGGQRRSRSARSRRGRGFRPLRVARVVPESAVDHLDLPGARRRRAAAAAAAGPVPDAARHRRATPRRCAATRCPTTPTAGAYRISVKREPHGARERLPARATLRPAATLDVAPPRAATSC